MQRYGTQLETFAQIRAKASRHAENNPLALFRKVVTPEEVMADVADLARRDDAADGVPADLRRRGAVVVPRASRADTALDRTVRILAQAMTTDTQARSTRVDDAPRRLRHGARPRRRCRSTRRRASGRRTSTCASCTTASRTTS
jgi:acetyl-CoA acetyltransferase